MSTVEKVAKSAPKKTKAKLLFSAEQLEVARLVGERLGRKQVLDALNELFNETDFIGLAKIKETKAYKGLQVIVEGKPVTIRTFEDYCLHVEGRTCRSIQGYIQYLNELSEELFLVMREYGVGLRTMRACGKLPDDDKKALLKLAQTGDKESFSEMAATLIKRNKKNSV